MDGVMEQGCGVVASFLTQAKRTDSGHRLRQLPEPDGAGGMASGGRTVGRQLHR